MMLTSLCTELYQFILCQGLFIGISSGLIFTPAISIVGHYFSRRRPIAMAFATTGSPLGGIIYPVIMTNLLPNKSVGFAWGQRTCGFLTLFLLAIAAITIRPTPLKRKGAFILPEAFKFPAFSLQVAALFMVILGLWTPYFYLADYGSAHGMSLNLASYLFALINAGSFLGRVFAGAVARHLGQFNVITVACYASGILMFCWLKITSSAGLIVLSILFGATSGIIIALMFTTIAHTADHPSKVSLNLLFSVLKANAFIDWNLFRNVYISHRIRCFGRYSNHWGPDRYIWRLLSRHHFQWFCPHGWSCALHWRPIHFFKRQTYRIDYLDYPSEQGTNESMLRFLVCYANRNGALFFLSMLNCITCLG